MHNLYLNNKASDSLIENSQGDEQFTANELVIILNHMEIGSLHS